MKSDLSGYWFYSNQPPQSLSFFLNLILSVFINGVSMVLCVWDHVYSSVSAETPQKVKPTETFWGSPGFSFTCNRWSGAISECSC